jgi:hypothetical protein
MTKDGKDKNGEVERKESNLHFAYIHQYTRTNQRTDNRRSKVDMRKVGKQGTSRNLLSGNDPPRTCNEERKKCKPK